MASPPPVASSFVTGENKSSKSDQVPLTRKNLSDGEKKKILEEYDKLPKMSQVQAGKQLGIPRETLRVFLKNRDKIVSSNQSSRKRKRSGKDPAVETALVQWVASAKKKAPLSGPLVRQKAEEMAKKMGKDNFVATDGWFQRFKKREGKL